MQNWSTIVRVYGKYKIHLGALVVLGLLGAVLDGIAINVAVPSLSFLSNPHTVPTDVISRSVAWLFSLVGISFTFRHLIIFITALLFGRAFVLVAFGYIRGWITGDFLANESKAILSETLEASWPYLISKKTGYIQNSFSRDMQRSSNLLEAFSQFAQSFTGFLMYLLVALNISPTTTLFTLCAGIVLAFLVRPLLKRTQALGREMAETERSVSQFVTEHLIGMKTVKAFGVIDRVQATGSRFFDRLHHLYTRMSFVRSLSTSFFQPFAMVFIIILFSLTYTSGNFDLIAFAATLYLIQKIFTYLESTQASISNIRELLPYAVQLDEFKQELQKAREFTKIDAGEEFSLTDEIRFSNVSFSYTKERPLFENLSLCIPSGKTTALIGPSGAGKTSVVDLLLRLFVPESGSITIDDTPLEAIPLATLRKNVAYVAQDPFLLHASIRDNIIFYRKEVTEEEVERAVEQAHIKEFVQELPEGLDTLVGDRGVLLSGGQRQRIALARALAGAPKLLLLDEATSALDRESEAFVQQSIEELHGKLTVIIIAHRLSTIEHADRVVVVESGRVTEEGSPEELLKTPDSYYRKHRA